MQLIGGHTPNNEKPQKWSVTEVDWWGRVSGVEEHFPYPVGMLSIVLI
jgi:hypothetical protein